MEGAAQGIHGDIGPGVRDRKVADINDAETIINERGRNVTPRENIGHLSTPDYVRNLLGDPNDLETPLRMLTSEQKTALVQIRFAEDMAALRMNGCAKRADDLARIDALERRVTRWIDRLVFIPAVMAGLAAIGGTLYWFWRHLN